MIPFGVEQSVAAALAQDAAEVTRGLLESVVLVDSVRGSGSGTIWSSDGVVVTNHHVVQTDQAKVTLHSGQELQTQVIRRDPERDLAALQVEVTGLPAIERGNSLKTNVGQWILAVGNPLGMRGVVTSGIITGVGQVAGPDRTWLDDMIQADVVLAPGNSGGPLADAQGRLLGINSMVLTSGLALAVPTHAVEALLSPMDATHLYLGVTGFEVTVHHQGVSRGAVLLVGVEEHGPGARAGLLQGDVVLRVDGRETHTGDELRAALLGRSSGPDRDIDVLRAGQPRTLTAVLGQRAA